MKPTIARMLSVLALVTTLAAPWSAALATAAGAGNLRPQALPNDTLFPKQWALTKVNLPQAWDITTGSPNVVIAIVDSGVDLTHPDLQSKLVPGRNILTGGANAQDDLNHGTHVAGIAAAAGNDGQGVAGACWGCKIMPVKVFNVTRDAQGNITCITANDNDVAAGIRWAVDNGAKIINLSAGGPDPKGPNATLQEAITYAYGKGALIVAAAGNNADDNPETDECGRPTGKQLEKNPDIYPAAMTNVLAVGATTNRDTRASYSEFKPYVKLAAPGGDTPAANETPEDAMIVSTDLRTGSSTGYRPDMGTSQAAPLVAGVAGLMWSVNPNLTNAQVEDILIKTAVDLGPPGKDNEYGYGRIDALAAVRAARAALPPTLTGPPDNAALSGLGATLTWQNPPGAVQFQIQVLPANFDGPAINLIIGDPVQVAAARFEVPAPVFGQGPYIMLPGMSYTWRVRTTDLATPMSESSPGWGLWSPFRTFRTPPPTAATLSIIAPADGATVSIPALGSLNLQWADSNRAVFYYEVQVSGDTRFDPDPATATSFVFWNLVHGGITTPPNSWAMPASALTPATTYYWRVRPRVQGDGREVAWGPTWSFKTP